MKKILFVDMDGTLAAWTPATSEELNRPRFFAQLPVNGSMVQAMRLIYEACQKHDNAVYILSAVLPNETVIQEKNEWLNKHCPYIKAENRIFVPYGANKAEFASEHLNVDLSVCYLLDDYSQNIKEWAKAGGHPIKVFNNINGKSLRFEGNYTCAWLAPRQVCNDVLCIMGEKGDENVRVTVQRMISENKDNFSYAAKGFDEGYASGYQDALVDILNQFGWKEDAEKIGYIN